MEDASPDDQHEESTYSSTAPSPQEFVGLTFSTHKPPPGSMQCEQCGAIFDRRHKYNRHLKSHARPYECTMPACVLRFTTKQDLTRHLNSVHRAGERYFCSVFGCMYSKGGTKSFARKDHLVRHMGTHVTQSDGAQVTNQSANNAAGASLDENGVLKDIEACSDEQQNPALSLGRGFPLQISPNPHSKIRLLEFDIHGNLNFTEFLGDDIPRYAILSHTWGPNEADEVTFQELMEGSGSTKAGYEKLRFCGKQAKADGLQYFWVDTCCINKSSSVELTVAINSMFQWYQMATKCYVYLPDVSILKRKASGGPSEVPWMLAFKKSRWFTRGWTLQELIAPPSVEFFSREGKRLGDKKSLELQIQNITGIPVQILQGSSLSQFSIDERMSWAAKRQTKVMEDGAYSLLGIFNVYMPLIYGEGREKAFHRLQIRISKLSTDKVKQIEEARKCLQALRTSTYEQFKDQNPSRIEGTCQWVLQHEKFRRWRESSSSAFLWISADPGCGKSVLSKALIDKDLKGTDSCIICYFFFKDNEKQRSVTTALSALLHQLFSQRPSLVYHAIQDFMTEGNQLSQSIHKLWNILIKVAADPQAGQIICILDALDECAELERNQFIDALSALYTQSTSIQRHSQLKFLITSRPYLNIERRFADLIQNFPTIRLYGEHESEAISHEINLVIRLQVLGLGRELKLDESEQSALENELLSIEHRTYLWLKLIIDVIRDEIGLTKKKLKRIINTLPATVDEAYEAILSKAKDQNKAEKLLHIIVAARRPLTLKEMNIALAIEDHHRSYEDLDLENETRFATTIRNLCGLFINIIDQKVYLIHQTAKDFLIAKGPVHHGGWKHSLNPVESELLMTRVCVNYLMFSIFEDSLIDDSLDNSSSDVDTARRSAAIKKLTKDHGYLRYAASSWGFHYNQAQRKISDTILQSALILCDTQSQRFQIWFNIYWNMAHRESNPQPDSIMVASYFGHSAVVRLLLDTMADVDAKDNSGRTPLSWAAQNGHDPVIKLLLKANTDVDSKDTKFGRTPLSRAAQNGHDAVVRLLLDTMADVDAKDNSGRTPLSWAAQNGHDAVVKLLLEVKADVDAIDNSDRTPLSWAAQNGHEAVVKLLLEVKADVDAIDNSDRTPLSWAAQNGHDAVVRLLLETRADFEPRDRVFGRTPLSWAAQNGHDAVVRLLLETRADVDANDYSRRTPLSWAAQNGHDAVVKLLLETRADVDANDYSRRTPLSWAAQNGHDAVVKLLLEVKADVDAIDNSDRTPLSWAAQNGHEAVVKLLLEVKADVDAIDNSDRTPLSWAAQNGHDAVVKLLLEVKADVDAIDNSDRTPLSWAA